MFRMTFVRGMTSLQRVSDSDISCGRMLSGGYGYGIYSGEAVLLDAKWEEKTLYDTSKENFNIFYIRDTNKKTNNNIKN